MRFPLGPSGVSEKWLENVLIELDDFRERNDLHG